MNNELFNLKRKVAHYKEVLANTEHYRQVWKESLKDDIIRLLEKVCQEIDLTPRIELRPNLENLQAIALSLGVSQSGMFQKIDHGVDVHLIKQNGALIYQQLFNGKVIVLVQYPFIENYGQPREPKTIAIYRPQELKEPFIIRHLEEFLQEVTAWEDYDDDEPNKRIGFELNFGGVKPE